MGYFPNGTSGQMFEHKYCDHCVHREGPDGNSGCAVMLSHILFAYKLCNDKEDEGKQILDILIPESNDHLDNDQCSMFHRGEAVVAKGCLDNRRLENPATVIPVMREWAKKHGLIVK